ncbi:MAG: DUF512 domain-containing protein, partial [Cyanobacteriota bacterium]|nr:DUF512 domain-containing protein [Cyanobacteriota bacterium]
PPTSHYEDYPQIGNGVGSIRKFLQEFEVAFESANAKSLTPRQTPRKLTWVVGNAVEVAFAPIVEKFNQISGLTLDMVPLNSQYWGQAITVTGLLTGQDLLQGLQGKNLGDAILLPSVMLKHGDTLFLDDMSVAELSQQLKTPILPVTDVEELISTALEA